MKAIRMVAAGRPLETQELPIPAIGRRDVLVRVRAAGICHSDAHYRAGKSRVEPLPLTLGHEVAGTIEAVGEDVRDWRAGDRVCIHYLLACGECHACHTGSEQFCIRGSMIGHFADGGYAEYIAVPARNAWLLPEEISFPHGAVLMCSSSTSFHALRKARVRAGESVAVFGAGGLGMSAIQLAKALGALEVYAVDIQPERLGLSASYGAIPVDARDGHPAATIRDLTQGRGVDVAIELVGLADTMQQAVRSLANLGRAVIAGIGDRPLEVDTYRELIAREAEIIGTNDHLAQELPTLLAFAQRGTLDLSRVVTRTVPLHADAINSVLDELERSSAAVRTVIVP